jgi:hypothetical protein
LASTLHVGSISENSSIFKYYSHQKALSGFVILPCRGVERIFSWVGRNRRLARDFQNLADTLATFVTLASIWLASGGLPGVDDE